MKTTRRFDEGEFVVEYVGELMKQKEGVECEESYPEEKGSFIMYPTNSHIHCMLVNLNNFA